MGEITVEIVDERFNRNPYIFPCKREDDIYPIWGQVCREILARIDLTDIHSVGCHRVGNAEVPDSCVPSILVAVSSKSNRNWNAVRDEIVGILMEAQVHTVGVIIQRDVALVHAGDRVSHSLLPEGWYTGGVIELKNPSTGEWVEFALTCYHCTIPNDKELARYSEEGVQVFSDWNRQGVRINDENASRLLIMDSPTQRDMRGFPVWRSLSQTCKTQEVSRAIEEGEFVIPPTMALWNMEK
ncbi:uncharacterized protein APUU_60884A [Aspergillus puulaauensis]|uniref:Uncharacterized protein n=1 Tax=Aspergillus puulaauensis TaxID=1220207 RepID=A0A7R8AQW4_9EURO|nr:uncharacterized protein APUU_60884A [Aspergillus puulaauensis]BCS27836.1 hypothetical protein APUU_60884A [Aspergillus puulaauensis]